MADRLQYSTSINLEQFSPVTSDKFYNIANYLLNQSVLLVDGAPYRLLEIEYYLTNDQHKDPYTHAHEDQETFGYWYFHKQGAGSYRGGTYKGLDITMGEPKSYCGILIRAISPIIYDSTSGKEVDGGKSLVINGPCRSVNHILEQFGFTKVVEFTDNELLLVSDERLKLVQCDNLQQVSIFRGPRVGLKNKSREWELKSYRYVIRPSYLTKKEIATLKEVKIIRKETDNSSESKSESVKVKLHMID